MSERHGVIFDVDGVLVDSYRAHLESWRAAACRWGLGEMTERQFAETFGRTSREIIREVWGDEVPAGRIGQFDEQKEAAYRHIIRDDFPEMDGAGDLLTALHDAGYALAVGSSGPPENLRVALECLPNGGLISAQVSGMDVERGKPDPQVFTLAAERIGLDPRRCAVVEDAPAGVTAGQRAGSAVIALIGTAGADELADADMTVRSLRELTPQIFEQLIRANVAHRK